jgi:hypothetical protein
MKTLVIACLLTCGASYAQGADAVESAYQAVLPEFTQTAYLAVVPAPYKTDYFVRVTPTGYDQLWLPPRPRSGCDGERIHALSIISNLASKEMVLYSQFLRAKRAAEEYRKCAGAGSVSKDFR